MDTFEALLSRKSTRRFKDKMPEKDIIEKIVEAGRHAPSGGNSQSTHLIVMTD